MAEANRQGKDIAYIHWGNSWQLRSFRDFRHHIDDLIYVSDLPKVDLSSYAAVIMPDAMDAAAPRPHAEQLNAYLKGGGFLDILGAVVGLGLQLGSIGAFGKKIAGRINSAKIPGYAGGTNFHPGGLALVGERGPELVDMPRGSRVYPNGSGPMGGGVVVNINAKDAVLTQQVRQWVAEGMAIAIDKGGDLGVARVGYRQRRRVA